MIVSAHLDKGGVLTSGTDLDEVTSALELFSSLAENLVDYTCKRQLLPERHCANWFGSQHDQVGCIHSKRDRY